jgi:hypothetical protein
MRQIPASRWHAEDTDKGASWANQRRQQPSPGVKMLPQLRDLPSSIPLGPVLSSRLSAALRFCYRAPHLPDDQHAALPALPRQAVLAHVPAGYPENGGFVAAYGINWMGTRLVTDLRNAMFAKLLAAPTA